MMKSYILVLVLLVGTTLGVAQNEPQRIVLTWEGDPATTQSVVWRTASSTDAQAQLAPLAKHVSDFEANAVTVTARTEEIETADANTYFHHTAQFTDLQPGSQYAYRVGNGVASWSEWNLFRTADDSEQPFSFMYLGDVQNNVFSDWSMLIRQAFAKAPEARFLLYAGDLVNRGRNDNEWQEFFDGLGFIARMRPAVPVPGNHDASKEILRADGSRSIDPLYLTHFALPMNGPVDEDLKETAYYMDYQGVRFIAFNSNSFSDPAQLEWLTSALESSSANWNIVFHHHPLFSTGNERDEQELRETLMPIYQQWGVDLVLQGHDHRYGRTNKILDGKTVTNDAEAPMYVVSVSGPKMYRHNEKFAPLMEVEKGETQSYQIISVTPDELRYEAWSLNDTRFDAFVLQKQDGGTVLTNLNE